MTIKVLGRLAGEDIVLAIVWAGDYDDVAVLCVCRAAKL